MTRDVRLQGLPHQIDFWQDYTDRLNIAMVGGYGTGKTYGLVVKWILLKFYNNGLHDMLVEPTYLKVKDTLLPTIEEVANDTLGIGVRYIGGDTKELRWPNGWAPTVVRSAEHPERLSGPNFASVGWDEPGQMSEDAWRRGSVRVRHPKAKCKQNYLAGTPEGINWFAARFGDPEDGYRTIRAKGWHRSIAGYKHEIVKNYAGSPHLLDAYLRGMFVPLAEGRVYHAFDRACHVSENGDLGYNPALPLHLTCDFNIHAMRWLVCQLHPGQVQVLDEIALGANQDVRAAAAEVIRRYHPEAGDEQPHGGAVIVTGDASGKGRTATGFVCYEQLDEALREAWPDVTLDVPAANPPVLDRVRTVNYHLSGAGQRILIHPRCVELIADLEQCVFRTGSQDIDKRDPQRTHASDAMGYLLHRYAPLHRPRPASVGRRPHRQGSEDNILQEAF